MLAKILIFIGSLIAVYIASKRHEIFAKVMSRISDTVGAKQPPPKQEKSESANTAQGEPEQIEELDYDPETGRYSIRKNRNS